MKNMFRRKKFWQQRKINHEKEKLSGGSQKPKMSKPEERKLSQQPGSKKGQCKS